MGYLAFFTAWVFGIVTFVLNGSPVAAVVAFVLPLAGYWLYRTERST